MSIVLFALAWLATWILCWWPLARVWPKRITPVYGGMRPRLTDGELVPSFGASVRYGAREWAPLIATVVAFAVDWIVT